MLSILTFNAALLDVRMLNHSVYCPVDAVPERLRRLIPALLSVRPDIICLQEVFHHNLQQTLRRQLAAVFPYIAGCIPPGPRRRLGNELLTLSRYPLTEVKQIRYQQASPEERLFTSKGFHHSIVTLPEIGNVNLINFHATAGGVHAHPEHDRMETIRHSQISQMLAYIEGMDRVILAGDLNAGPHTSYRNYWQVLQAGFIDAFAAAGGDGYTWDPGNPLVANGKEQHLPAQKIDHVFINGALSQRLISVDAAIILKGDPQNGGGPLSDHYGIVVKFDKVA